MSLYRVGGNPEGITICNHMFMFSKMPVFNNMLEFVNSFAGLLQGRGMNKLGWQTMMETVSPAMTADESGALFDTLNASSAGDGQVSMAEMRGLCWELTGEVDGATAATVSAN